MNSTLSNFVSWYASQCDGDWEHVYGFEIHTLDNPGIKITISLKETNLENKNFKDLKVNYESDTEWMFCQKTSTGHFEGVGSPDKLEEILNVFLTWAKE